MTGPEQHYRRCLLAYPPDYRRDHGDELVDIALDAGDDVSAPGLAQVGVAREMGGLVLGGLRERARRGAAQGLAGQVRAGARWAALLLVWANAAVALVGLFFAARLGWGVGWWWIGDTVLSVGAAVTAAAGFERTAAWAALAVAALVAFDRERLALEHTTGLSGPKVPPPHWLAYADGASPAALPGRPASWLMAMVIASVALLVGSARSAESSTATVSARAGVGRHRCRRAFVMAGSIVALAGLATTQSRLFLYPGIAAVIAVVVAGVVLVWIDPRLLLADTIVVVAISGILRQVLQPTGNPLSSLMARGLLVVAGITVAMASAAIFSSRHLTRAQQLL